MVNTVKFQAISQESTRVIKIILFDMDSATDIAIKGMLEKIPRKFYVVLDHLDNCC